MPFSKIQPRHRPPSVTRQVADHLARLIAAGTLKPGEKLPGETVLARRFEVSRPTVRQALGLLKERDLLEVRPRSGTYVRRPGEGQAAELLDDLLSLDLQELWELLEIRRILDPEMAALAARRCDTRDLDELRELLAPLEGDAGDRLIHRERSARTYGRFFALLARSTHNDLVLHLTETLGGMLRDALAYSRLRLAARPAAAEAIRDHLQQIVAAVAEGDADAAREATARHLGYVETTLREIEVER